MNARERSLKAAATLRGRVEQRYTERTEAWRRQGFFHHADILYNRLDDVDCPTDLIRSAYDDATEFLTGWVEHDPLARLIDWPTWESFRLASRRGSTR